MKEFILTVRELNAEKVTDKEDGFTGRRLVVIVIEGVEEVRKQVYSGRVSPDNYSVSWVKANN